MPSSVVFAFSLNQSVFCLLSSFFWAASSASASTGICSASSVASVFWVFSLRLSTSLFFFWIMAMFVGTMENVGGGSGIESLVGSEMTENKWKWNEMIERIELQLIFLNWSIIASVSMTGWSEKRVFDSPVIAPSLSLYLMWIKGIKTNCSSTL